MSYLYKQQHLLIYERLYYKIQGRHHSVPSKLKKNRLFNFFSSQHSEGGLG